MNMKTLCVLIVAQSLATTGFAQNITGTVAGRVTDSTGATVADVAVTLLNIGTGLKLQARTADPRRFCIPSTAAGTLSTGRGKGWFSAVRDRDLQPCGR